MEKANILIIEDKKEDALFLEDTLKAQDYKVWTAHKPEEGVKIARNVPFGVVLTELYMPGINGIEITKEMFKINPAINTIVMTAYSFIEFAVEAMEAGAYGYITKPFNVSEIKIMIKRALERHALLSSNLEKEQFAEMSVKDSLTGAYNRRFLKVYINNKIMMMNRMLEKFSVLMIDIDFFKKYNDTNGHLAGDELLRKVAKLFYESIRKGDFVFRYGGEEFLLFLDNADKQSAYMVAERIRTTISLYLPATVSIGISTFPEDGEDFEKIVSNADGALYKAKESGRNKCCLT